jgi:hypothetical protein
MSDMSFERKFGQLVDAQVNEKLPSLVDSRIGFQVIDKNEDETRAVGVAAFVVNDVWLYIPVFFLNGEMKGFDLVYMKNKDIFIPAMDNWIETIKDQGITALGTGRDKGKDEEFVAGPADTHVFVTEASTFGKNASFDANSLIEKEEWDRMVSHSRGDVQFPDLMSDIPKLGKTACKAFIDSFMQDADFANALFSNYSVEDLQKVATECAVVAFPDTPVEEEEVKIYTQDMPKEAKHDLEDTEKRLLMNQGIYVKDNRTNHSKVFQESVDTSTYQNPVDPGIYDIFLQNGEHKTFIVLTPQLFGERGSMNISRPSRSSKGRTLCLIDPDNPKKYIRKENTDVYGKPSTNIDEKTTKAVQGGRKASLRTLKDIKKDVYMLFVHSANSSIETCLRAKKHASDGSMYVTVKNTTGNGNVAFAPLEGDQELMVEFTGPDGKLKVHGNKLFVPEGTRIFTHDPYSASTDKNTELLLGGPSSMYQLMHKQANLHHLSITHSGDTATIKFDGESEGMVSKVAALTSLVKDHGIYAGQAVQMLKEAEKSPYSTKGFLIKHAASYDSAAYGASQRPFQGGPGGQHENAVTVSVNTTTGNKHSQPKDSQDKNILPEEAIEQAQQASAAGIKEVFDVSVIESLLDIADVGELRRDYITDMIRGMDKVGRMLFIYYWHNDEFEDRYGKEDMIKLEDTLKQVFQSTGDLVLFLKEKTAFNPDSSESLLGSLSEGIATAGE